MKYCFIDHPRYIPKEDYDRTIEQMINILTREKGIISIYQIGSISNPGISDIDLVAVFDDNVQYPLSPLGELNSTHRYLFTHGLYGVSKKHLNEVKTYTLFHNWRLVWGETLIENVNGLSEEEIATLKIQTAFEYLLKMYINMTIEKTYRIIKLRNLLLHVKALQYDLEYLNVTSGEIMEMVDQIIKWRNNWFNSQPSKEVISEWIKKFYDELYKLLNDTFKREKLYLPGIRPQNITKNIRIIPADHFHYFHKGVVLPSDLGIFSRKIVNLQHRFNKFDFFIPLNSLKLPSIIEKRFVIFGKLIKDAQLRLLAFSPPISPLNIVI
jgi:hypothetical protein